MREAKATNIPIIMTKPVIRHTMKKMLYQIDIPCILESSFATSDHIEFVLGSLQCPVNSDCNGHTVFISGLFNKMSNH